MGVGEGPRLIKMAVDVVTLFVGLMVGLISFAAALYTRGLVPPGAFVAVALYAASLQWRAFATLHGMGEFRLGTAPFSAAVGVVAGAAPSAAASGVWPRTDPTAPADSNLSALLDFLMWPVGMPPATFWLRIHGALSHVSTVHLRWPAYAQAPATPVPIDAPPAIASLICPVLPYVAADEALKGRGAAATYGGPQATEDCMGRRVVVPPRGFLGVLWAAWKASALGFMPDYVCLLVKPEDVPKASLVFGLLAFLLLFMPAIPALPYAASGDAGARTFVALMTAAASLVAVVAFFSTTSSLTRAICRCVAHGRQGWRSPART